MLYLNTPEVLNKNKYTIGYGCHKAHLYSTKVKCNSQLLSSVKFSDIKVIPWVLIILIVHTDCFVILSYDVVQH